MKILIKDGCVHRFNKGKSIFEIKDILISENKIVDIGRFSFSQDIDKIIDAKGCIIIPGLVNAHLHSHDHFNKASVDNLPLEQYLLYLRPFYTGIKSTPEETYLRTLYGCIEMIKTGTTTIIDDVIINPFMDEECLDAVISAYRDAGMRGYVASHILNRRIDQTIPYLDQTLRQEIIDKLSHNFPSEKELLKYYDKKISYYNESQHIMKLTLAPSAPQRCSLNLLRGIKGLSQKHKIPIISHVLESKMQKYAGDYFFKKSLISYLNDNGLLYKNLCSVHSVWVDDEDIELLKLRDCSIVHNPASNLKLGSGIAPVEKFLSKDINTSLGTDNISANDTINMFESMKLTGLIHKTKCKDYQSWISADDAFNMATVGGAKTALLENKIGSIEIDKCADLVIIDANNEHFIPSNDYIKSIVYAENGSSVKTVIINGELIMEDREIKTFDEKQVLLKILEIQPRIKENLDNAYNQAKLLHEDLDKAYELCLKDLD